MNKKIDFTILIADDESLECDAFEFMVSKSPFNAECIKAKNGREAVDLAKLHRPQLIVLDIQMPGMSGLEAAEQIRDFLPASVIVFVTAWSRFDFAQKAIRVKAADYLVKPIDQEMINKLLENYVQKHLNDAKENNTEVLNIYDNELLNKHITILQDSVLNKTLEETINAEQDFLQAVYKLLGKEEKALNTLKKILPAFFYNISTNIQFLSIPQTDNAVSIAEIEHLFASFICNATKAAISDRQDKYKRIFEHIQDYIEKNYASELTTEQICSVFDIHSGYFPQLFHKYCGQQFVKYLTDTRMKHAKEFLLQGETVKECAYKTGFSDTNYFSKVFKKYFNCSPSDYKG